MSAQVTIALSLLQLMAPPLASTQLWQIAGCEDCKRALRRHMEKKDEGKKAAHPAAAGGADCVGGGVKTGPPHSRRRQQERRCPHRHARHFEPQAQRRRRLPANRMKSAKWVE